MLFFPIQVLHLLCSAPFPSATHTCAATTAARTCRQKRTARGIRAASSLTGRSQERQRIRRTLQLARTPSLPMRSSTLWAGAGGAQVCACLCSWHSSPPCRTAASSRASARGSSACRRLDAASNPRGMQFAACPCAQACAPRLVRPNGTFLPCAWRAPRRTRTFLPPPSLYTPLPRHAPPTRVWTAYIAMVACATCALHARSGGTRRSIHEACRWPYARACASLIILLLMPVRARTRVLSYCMSIEHSLFLRIT